MYRNAVQQRELLNQATLNINDKSVVHIILQQPLHGRVDIINVDVLNLACDIVLAAEVEHVLSLLDAANRAATNSKTTCSTQQISAATNADAISLFDILHSMPTVLKSSDKRPDHSAKVSRVVQPLADARLCTQPTACTALTYSASQCNMSSLKAFCLLSPTLQKQNCNA